jgi:glycosyltransferase involved in cell wall biosynthesis
MPPSVRDWRGLASARKSLLTIIRRFEPDIVHCHGLRSALVTLISGARPVVTVHGWGQHPTDPPGYNLIRRISLHLAPFLCEAVIAAFPGLRGWRFIPHASPRLKESRVLRLNLRDAIPTFLWLGRLDEPKRPDLFIRAIAQLSGALAVRGLVAGTGPLEGELRQLAGVSGAPVQFLGQVDDPSSALARAWGVVMLTRFQAPSLAAQEAMWCGRPVIATTSPGMRWLVGETGFLVEGLGDLVDALRKCARRETADPLGKAARARIVSILDPDSPWPVVSELYERVTS